MLVGAHPRGCGEHDRKRFLKMFEEGSSPRVRGTLLALFGWGDGDGLIPAGAGNMLVRGSQASRRRAHPRGCGEHGDDGSLLLEQRGSSPRVRGTYEVYIPGIGWVGLIPAGAGNMRLTLWFSGH